jgi:hypothetical protein
MYYRLFYFLHLSPVGISLMIISHEMHEPMDDDVLELFFVGFSSIFCIGFYLLETEIDFSGNGLRHSSQSRHRRERGGI